MRSRGLPGSDEAASRSAWVRRVVVGGLGTAGATVALAALAASAFANAANPTAASSTETLNTANGTVTVTVSGSWSWGQLAGVQTSPQNDCAGRSGVGWSVDWWGMTNSATPTAGMGPTSGSLVNPATSQTNGPTPTSGSLSVAGTWQVKSGASNGQFFHTSHLFNGFTSDLCSHKDPNGAPIGSYSATATYPSLAAVPAKICVNFYDPHGKQGQYSTAAKDNFADQANDNSITTNSFDPLSVQGNCSVPVLQNPSMSVVKDNNAGGSFQDVGQASSLGQDVTFRAIISNTSPVALTIDTVKDAVPTGGAGSTVACLTAGNHNVVGDTLQPKNTPGDSETCFFTIPNYLAANGIQVGSSLVDDVIVTAHSSNKTPAQADDTSVVKAPNPNPTLGAHIRLCSSNGLVPGGNLLGSGPAGATLPVNVQDFPTTGEPAGNYSVTATAPDGYVIVDCPAHNFAKTSTLTATLPPNADLNFYVAPAPGINPTKDGPATGVAGTDGVYTITVTNTSSQVTFDAPIVFFDRLPAGETFLSAHQVDINGNPINPNLMSCAPTNDPQLVQCTYSHSLAPGAFAQVQVTIHWASNTGGLTLTDCAGTTAANSRPTVARPDQCVDTVIPKPSISVVKTNDANGDGIFHDTESAAQEGDSVTFKVVVTNTSKLAIVLDSVTDAFDATTLAECPQLLTGPPLASGDSVTCEFTVDNYAPAAGDSLTDKVTVNGHEQTGGTPVSAFDTSTVNTKKPPTPGPDLAIVKNADQAKVKAGDTLTYTLSVTNVGAGPTTGATTVTDTVPDGLDLVSVGTGGAWNCTTSGRDITCTYAPTVAPGETLADITIVTTVNDTAVGSVINTGVVSTPGDTNPLNDRSTVKTPVTKVLPEKIVKTPPTQVLPFTGDRTGQMLPIGLIAVLVGLMLVVAGRRRRTA